MFYKDDRLMVMIDGLGFHRACKSLGIHADFGKLRDEFTRRGKLRRISYYAVSQDTEEHNPLQPVIDWLSYNGFHVVRKTVRAPVPSPGDATAPRPRGSADVEFAVDILRNSEFCDHLVLVTGSRDMVYPLQLAQRNGCRISVLSTIRGDSTAIADELRRAADEFIELDHIRHLIARDPDPAERDRGREWVHAAQ